MSQFEIELSLDDVPADALVRTIERFALWREETACPDRRDRDLPDLMMKTVCSPTGRLKRRICLAEQSWATAFMSFWETELNELAV